MRSRTAELPTPWREFLDEVDDHLPTPVEIHCVGGFVLTVLYDLPRPTADIDFINCVPDATEDLIMNAGVSTPLAKKHGVYLEFVGLGDYPDDYDSRLIEIETRLSRLRLLAFDPNDLILAKLTRNSPKDRFDVKYLAERGELDAAILRQRYEENMRSYLANDLTLQLWLEEYLGV